MGTLWEHCVTCTELLKVRQGTIVFPLNIWYCAVLSYPQWSSVVVRKHDPDAAHLRVRIDGRLLRRLEQAAKRSNRSLNNEVVTRLDASFRADPAEIDAARERLRARLDEAEKIMAKGRQQMAEIDEERRADGERQRAMIEKNEALRDEARAILAAITRGAEALGISLDGDVTQQIADRVRESKRAKEG